MHYIDISDSLVSIVMAGMQTIFCNWFAFHKRATVEEHLVERPGYQGLQFLRSISYKNQNTFTSIACLQTVNYTTTRVCISFFQMHELCALVHKHLVTQGQ